MMLRSSSTPVLGSLLSSYSESPNENNKISIFDNHHNHHHQRKSISFSHGGNLNFSSFSCNSSHSISGFSDSEREFNSNGGFRRAQSDGNLEGLAAASCDFEGFSNSSMSNLVKSSRRSSISLLQTIPSFSFYNSRNGFDEEDEYGEEEEERESGFDENEGGLERTITIGDNIIAIGNGSFNFEENSKMSLIEEEKRLSDFQYLGVDENSQSMNPSLFLAKGLGIEFGDGDGGGGDYNPVKVEEGGQEEANMEEYYKKMVEENPSSPLFLRNYAEFLYKSKGDLRGADEYYSRAILTDPEDGELLSQYAKLVWELHHDHRRASSYFERAVQAAPQDSHVHAAYASFLWETEEEEEEEEEEEDVGVRHSPVGMRAFHGGAMASTTA